MELIEAHLLDRLSFDPSPSEPVLQCHCEGVKRLKQSQKAFEETRLPRLRAETQNRP
jgi:hypothetical protein